MFRGGDGDLAERRPNAVHPGQKLGIGAAFYRLAMRDASLGQPGNRVVSGVEVLQRLAARELQRVEEVEGGPKLDVV